MVHRTLANLSRLPEPLVALIEQYCQGQLPTGASPSVRMGPCYGILAGLHALAGAVGLVAALGSDRSAKLALFLIYARVARQGSRLAGAVRWAEDHALAEVLGLARFDEDDLSAPWSGCKSTRNASSGRWLRRSKWARFFGTTSRPPILKGSATSSRRTATIVTASATRNRLWRDRAKFPTT